MPVPRTVLLRTPPPESALRVESDRMRPPAEGVGEVPACDMERLRPPSPEIALIWPGTRPSANQRCERRPAWAGWVATARWRRGMVVGEVGQVRFVQVDWCNSQWGVTTWTRDGTVQLRTVRLLTVPGARTRAVCEKLPKKLDFRGCAEDLEIEVRCARCFTPGAAIAPFNVRIYNRGARPGGQAGSVREFVCQRKLN